MHNKILVIDDHVMVAEAIAGILSEYEVTIVSNKANAIKAAKRDERRMRAGFSWQEAA